MIINWQINDRHRVGRLLQGACQQSKYYQFVVVVYIFDRKLFVLPIHDEVHKQMDKKGQISI